MKGASLVKFELKIFAFLVGSNEEKKEFIDDQRL